MSTTQAWRKISKRFLSPPKPRTSEMLKYQPSVRAEQLRPSNRAVEKSKMAPSVFPFITGRNGWKPTRGDGDYKIRHKWRPNFRKWRVPVNILAGDEAHAKPNLPYVRMHMNMKQMQRVEAAGGLEAYMVSNHPDKFNDHGKMLRNGLITQLYRLREQMYAERGRPGYNPYAARDPQVEMGRPMGGVEGGERMLQITDGKKKSQ